MLKRAGIKKLIESSWLELSGADIRAAFEKCQPDDLLLMIRMLAFVKFEPDSEMLEFLVQQRNAILGPYEAYLAELLQPSHPEEAEGSSPGSSYDWRTLSREIVVYSHHEISWLSHAFNLFQAYSLLFLHIQNLSSLPLPPAPVLWNQLLVTRPSAIPLLQASTPQDVPLLLTLLTSRHREVRHHALLILQAKYPVSPILTLLQEIDQEDIDLENERDVKRKFHQLEEAMKGLFEGESPDEENSRSREHLLHWSLGFAFTGFKLIQPAFISFFSQLTAQPLPPQSTATLLRFLDYYHYRHSRQYEFDLSELAPEKHLANHFEPRPSVLDALIQEDLEVAPLETIEWIGLERIAEAIRNSGSKGKKQLGQPLRTMVETYFQVEFTRQQRVIKQLSSSQPSAGESGAAQLGSVQPSAAQPISALLMPIKSRFLAVMLKLCPVDYLPPFECLHFLREEYFELPRVRALKKHSWESLWQKRDPQKKGESNERTKNSVNLQNLSPEELEMYLHYLWKEILEGNHQRVRIILEHLRNELAKEGYHACRRLAVIYFTSLGLQDLPEQEQEAGDCAQAVRRLRLMNRKVLLSHMFILKGLLAHLKHDLELGKVIQLAVALIQVVYPHQSPQDHSEQEEDEGEAMEE